MTLFRRLLPVLAVVMSIGAGVFVLPAAAMEKVTIVAAGKVLHYMGHQIAQSQGFYKEEGIDVDWVSVKSGALSTAALMGGQADLIVTGFIENILLSVKSPNVVIVSTQFDIMALRVVLSNAAMAKTGITETMPIDEKVRRLRGLKIGISAPGSTTDAIIRRMLLARNINPDKEVTLQPLGDGGPLIAALEQNIIDGFVYGAPFPEIVVSRGLGKIAIEPFSNEVPELEGVAWCSFSTTRTTLAKNPKKVTAMIRAYTKAMNFIRTNPEKARQVVRSSFPDMEDAVFNLAFNNTIRGMPKTPVVTEHQFQHTLDWINIADKTKPVKASYGAVVDNSIAAAVAKELRANY